MKPISIIQSVNQGGQQSVIEMEITPRTGNPSHYHTLFEETFAVLQGELSVRKGRKKAC